MFDVLEAFLPARFAALDLGCGPGSLSARLLRRFPQARVLAVDFDPVVLRVGRGALGTVRGRLTWIDANLSEPGWTDLLPRVRFDAALSTTALHWLGPASLRRLYRELAGLLRPRGVFLNGDVLPWDPNRRALRRLSEKVRAVRFSGKSLQSEWKPWERWWRDIRRVSALRDEFREREARLSQHPETEPTSIGVHARALRRAGFRVVDVVWQDFDNRILLGLR